jgi:hypothetical protein
VPPSEVKNEARQMRGLSYNLVDKSIVVLLFHLLKLKQVDVIRYEVRFVPIYKF